MAFKILSSLGLAIFLANFLFFSTENAAAQAPSRNVTIPFTKHNFPPKFIFGAASSAYQYEGAAAEDGRGPSVADTFTHGHPELIADHSTGDVADDFYHRYKEDVKLMKFIGMNGFRFSISWSRVLPHGKLSKGVNKLGIAFYNNLINELLSNGITPFVTLFHWDTPQALEDEYGSFRNISIVDDFRDYAELCFREFGDRVKHWTTFNEPWSFSTGGYDSTSFIGSLGPGRCSKWMNKCKEGDSSTEPYLVAHHILLSHATAARLYRKKYKKIQKGSIGIVLVTNWMMPLNPRSKADVLATKRAQSFYLGWFLDPLTYGDYPTYMKEELGDRLPKFTTEESEFVKGTLDFLGLNYYTANYVEDIPTRTTVNTSYTTDVRATLTGYKNGKALGASTAAPFLFVYPQGLPQLLVYIKNNYKSPIVYITENGLAEINIDTVKEGTNDTNRVSFYYGHFKALEYAIKKGVDVRGFFAWSFLDTFEWGSGYAMRFGLNFVDYKDGLKRYPKKSAFWMKQFLE